MFVLNKKTKFSEAILFIQIYEMDHKGELPTPTIISKEMKLSRSTAAEALHEVKSMREGLLGQIKLTKAQEYHIEIKLKLLSRKLETEFAERVRLATLEKSKSYLADLEELKKKAQEKYDLHNKLINNYKPLLTEDEFRAILVCLHPDNSASEERRKKAFTMFNAKKFQLTGNK
jgi:hypothetical protein